MTDTITSPEGVSFYPTGELEVRNKYIVGQVVDEGNKQFFLKAVKERDNPAVQADLQNEVHWNQVISPQVDEDYWSIPEVVTHAPDYKWAVFEYVSGAQPREEEIENWVPVVTGIAMALGRVPLGRTGSDLTKWYQGRLGRFDSVTGSSYFDEADRKAVDSLINGGSIVSRIRAGVIHGDLNLKNLILANSDDWHTYLIDGEFGTLPGKPEWDKPRYHDIAYFYHLLRCQYHRPDLAEGFLQTCWLNVEQRFDTSAEDFMAEFNLSVLERTISMMSHFIINLAEGKVVDDERRTVAEPYVETIHSALEILTKP